MSWPHTNYQHTLFHLLIIQTKRPILKEASGGKEKTRGWEVTEQPCVITNKDLIKLDSMPRKTAKGSQLLIKANKCLFKINAHECRQNWASVIVNLHRRCKDHSEGNGQQFFWSMCPHSVPVTSSRLVQTWDRNVAHWSHIHAVPGESWVESTVNTSLHRPWQISTTYIHSVQAASTPHLFEFPHGLTTNPGDNLLNCLSSHSCQLLSPETGHLYRVYYIWAGFVPTVAPSWPRA